MKLTRRQLILGSSMAVLTAYAEPIQQKAREGRIAVPGGNVVWRRFGDGPKTPLILIHGGPGFPSDYLQPFSLLGDERPVFVWDQLGCGRSDRPSDQALWSVERFVQEFDILRRELAPGPVHVLGHSWGSMLAMEWLMTTRPKDVKSVVFAGECLSVPRYIEDARELIKTLSPESQAAIAEAERTGKYDTRAYQMASSDWAPRYLVRRASPDTNEFLKRSLETMGTESYTHMWGPSEFQCTGVLKTFDRTKDLASLRLPVLFLNGEFDECRPETARAHAAMTPGAALTVIPGAAHLTMLDAPAASSDAVRKFIGRVETA
jgi:proline iminopeptidase